MEIFLNNLPKQVADASTLLQVVQVIFPDNRPAMAIAVNQMVVPKSAWDHHILHPADQLTVIVPTQGG